MLGNDRSNKKIDKISNGVKKLIIILLFVTIPFMQGCLALLASAAASYGLYQVFNK